MKLRLVKFFTSRGNEIEKKEDEDCHCVLSPPARPRPELPLPLLLPSSFRSLFLHPAPPARIPSLQLVGRHVSGSSRSSYPRPNCSASPFLLHKITEAEERDGHCVAERPASRPSCSTTWRRPARRTLALPVPRLSSTVSAFSHLKVRSIHIERSHRKTKTENKLSCFVSFIDE